MKTVARIIAGLIVIYLAFGVPGTLHGILQPDIAQPSTFLKVLGWIYAILALLGVLGCAAVFYGWMAVGRMLLLIAIGPAAVVLRMPWFQIEYEPFWSDLHMMIGVPAAQHFYGLGVRVVAVILFACAWFLIHPPSPQEQAKSAAPAPPSNAPPKPTD